MKVNDWWAKKDLGDMLWFIESFATERQYRLFACACVRMTWHLVPSEFCRAAVEACERHVDTGAELKVQGSFQLYGGLATQIGMQITQARPQDVAGRTANMTADILAENAAMCMALLRDERGVPVQPRQYVQIPQERWDAAYQQTRQWARLMQNNLLRDIIGPLRPPDLDTRWRKSPDVLTVARAFYEHRQENGHLELTRASILADALQDVGCPDDHDMITHLRGPGPHVRGCWVADWVLEKN